ncbi:hypothetical protein Anapl_03976 [Anas platyrhynchos]|uniref:Uncharacterized protein n=1 Tax=Anas platyrhynchos TaxID=8839 RepID=R0KFT4_ANAPL|nr:hypothetical protein Anapl_03976 [Anas platyrhynchos]
MTGKLQPSPVQEANSYAVLLLPYCILTNNLRRGLNQNSFPKLLLRGWSLLKGTVNNSHIGVDFPKSQPHLHSEKGTKQHRTNTPDGKDDPSGGTGEMLQLEQPAALRHQPPSCSVTQRRARRAVLRAAAARCLPQVTADGYITSTEPHGTGPWSDGDSNRKVKTMEGTCLKPCSSVSGPELHPPSTPISACLHFSLLSEKWGAVPEGWRRAVRTFPLSVPSLVEKQRCSALSRDLGASKEVKCNKANRLNKALCWPPRNLLCHCSPEGSAESLCGGRMAGQPSKVTAIAVKPSPHFLENLCGHGANPYNQTLTKRGSRKSIKPSLHSSQLPFPLASATCAFQAPLHNEQSISPSPGHSPQHCH